LTIAGGAVEASLYAIGNRKWGATAGWEPLHLVESLDIVTAMLERPKLRRQSARRRLEQSRDIDVIGTEPHTMLAQDGPQSLVEALEIIGDLAALKNSERFHKLIGNAAGEPRDVLGRTQHEQWREKPLDMSARPQVETDLHGIERGSGQLFVSKDTHPRTQHSVARHDLGDRFADPADRRIRRQHKLRVGCVSELVGASLDFASQRLLRRRGQRL